jgi:D-alanyl-lipoteichoic acid acyltransferase DltB (MBOAT superfamily)
LFKKVVIAHYVSQNLVQPVFENPMQFSTLDVLFGAYGYAVQIYCDFSAYTDIAIGVAALLGFRFMRNFNQPYRARSLQDFWRRWHISLSSWLRDYLYIPLGGSRQGKLKSYRNLLLTMLLGGLWHGAAWKFVMWGALHGGYLAVEKAARERFGSLDRGPWTGWLATLVVFHFVCLTWIFFAAGSFSAATDYLVALGNTHLAVQQLTGFTFMLVVLSLASQFLPSNSMARMQGMLESLPVPLQGALAGVVTMMIVAIGPAGVAPFIYFQF